MRVRRNPLLNICTFLPLVIASAYLGTVASSPALASHLECKKVLGHKVCVRVPDDPTIPQKIPGGPSSSPTPATPAPTPPNYVSHPSNISFPDFAEPYISTQFSQEERQIIWAALNRAQSGLKDTKIQNCISKYGIYKYQEGANRLIGKNGNGTGAGQWVYQELNEWFATQFPGRSPKRYTLHIDKMNEQSNTLGHAELRLFNRTNGNDFNITLNAYQLSQNSSSQLWAGVIVHEMLHNIQYDHPQFDSRNPNAEAGNVVYEAGWCLERAGADKVPGTFGLTGDGGTFYD